MNDLGITIPAPPDIENGVARESLRYRARLPDAGIGPATGLILYVPGYGFDIDDAYTPRLHAKLANTHDCMVVTPDYFGCRLMAAGLSVLAAPDLVDKVEQHHGLRLGLPDEMPPDMRLTAVIMFLQRLGITSPHPECRGVVDDMEYHSFGLLPALDCLQTVFDALSRFPLDRSRIFAIGSSYGGYIASLAVKLAPDTFRMVVDNCGFSGAEDDWSAVMGYFRRDILGVSLVVRATRHWTSEPGPWHFGEAQRRLRSLVEGWSPSRTHLYCYHSAQDSVAPTERKRGLPQAVAGRLPYDLRIIGPSDVDGVLFKHPDHGLGASLFGLFGLSMQRYLATAPTPGSETDFSWGNTRRFAFGDTAYAFTFSPRHGVTASLA